MAGTDFPLFDDNPSTIDLLGLDSIAGVISNAAMSPALDPVTIGINSPWGGGKSTVLNLIEGRLSTTLGALVVRVDPWEFVDSGDARGTLISRVLDGLEVAFESYQTSLPAGDARDVALEALTRLKEKALDLKRRISWSKVAQVALKSAVTLTPNIAGLVDALTPAPTEDSEKDFERGMRAFRSEFARLIEELPATDRVVVLVDDLDRCLPGDVLGTFEAIKLFLSVKRVAFVIAADEAFIRDSLRQALTGREAAQFAGRYTEKVIQLPFTLPQLTPALAEAYVALLLTQASGDCEVERIARLANAAMSRRAAGIRPYVFENMEAELPTREVVHRAAAMVRGMSAGNSTTPRQLKRFLNNLSVRASILAATSDVIDIEIVMKLWILEQNHFNRFLELASLASPERSRRLAEWEQDDSYGEIHEWANDGSELSADISQVDTYLSLAAAVVAEVGLGPVLTGEDSRRLAELLSDSDLVRRAAQAEFDTVGDGDEALMQHLASAILGSRREHALDSLQQVGIRRPDLVDAASGALIRPEVLGSLDRLDLPWLARFPIVLEELGRLHSSDSRFAESIADEMRGQTV
ncbi:KAP family P-loop NTPase fold protein [Microbacterium oleivorans]|uniref:KAP NTPase domain-containing protein n=1 Tax=Microbacterium oleivorans TaxID=273677 RepID=A0A4R5YKK0_9MICO|nr:P-loop NTPase fold protein [Microbacterium oleivorans]TDL45042.1 hypothetical protein E2R54_00695 [Microbacterium oleivorans]